MAALICLIFYCEQEGTMMYDLRNLVPIGSTASISRVVRDSDTATNFSPNLETLLATPASIGMAIQACAEAVDRYLPEGFVSIGRSITFEHTAPTLLGVKVTMTAEIIEVTPTYITIKLTLSDDVGEIGHGEHKRSIVNHAALLEKAKRRVDMMTNQMMT